MCRAEATAHQGGVRDICILSMHVEVVIYLEEIREFQSHVQYAYEPKAALPE